MKQCVEQLHQERIRTLIQFSIITICLNAENCIRETIQSVLSQTASNFEYIIKDGMSTDKTINIAESFTTAFAERGISYRIISQKDDGIYDAMNQAVLEAQGEWLLFMNAGDRIAAEDVLSLIEHSGCLEKADIVYGDRVLATNDLYLYSKAKELEKITKFCPFGHQSVFTKRQLLLDNPYSTKYRICSDYQFYLQKYHEGKYFAYYPIPVSIYDMNGLSAVNRVKTKEESIDIHEKQSNRDEENIEKEKKSLRRYKRNRFISRCFFRFVPKSLKEKKRRYLLIKQGWKTKEELFSEQGPVAQAIKSAALKG